MKSEECGFWQHNVWCHKKGRKEMKEEIIDVVRNARGIGIPICSDFCGHPSCKILKEVIQKLNEIS